MLLSTATTLRFSLYSNWWVFGRSDDCSLSMRPWGGRRRRRRIIVILISPNIQICDLEAGCGVILAEWLSIWCSWWNAIETHNMMPCKGNLKFKRICLGTTLNPAPPRSKCQICFCRFFISTENATVFLTIIHLSYFLSTIIHLSSFLPLFHIIFPFSRCLSLRVSRDFGRQADGPWIERWRRTMAFEKNLYTVAIILEREHSFIHSCRFVLVHLSGCILEPQK